MNLNNMKIFSDGELPVLSAVYDQLKIGDKINESVKWNIDTCTLSPGQIVKALVLNILTDRKPLYRIQEFYADKDVKKLIGENADHSNINEFCIGRTLDKIYKSIPEKVYSYVALTAMDIEKIDIKSIHWDTTSKSLQGEYSVSDVTCEPETKPIEIVRGYSKDLRGDLKQIKFGMGVNKDKFPIFANVLSGNVDDKKWSLDIVKTMQQKLESLNLNKIIHVFDSALVTKENLRTIDSKYKFISRLPGTFSLENTLIQRSVKAKTQWMDIGRLSDKEGSSHYKIQSYIEEIEGKKYRFIVCHSSNLNKQKIKTITADIEKEKKEIKTQIDKLVLKKGYSCYADAQKSIDTIEKKIKKKYHSIKFTIIKEERRKKKSKAGPYKKDELPEIEEIYVVNIQILNDEEKILKKQEEAGFFVLITSVLDKNELEDVQVLQEYKNQQSVESTFRILKDPCYVDEIFLKKPERIEAFGYIMVIAVLMLNVLEKRIRDGLKNQEKPIELQGRRKTFTPTAKTILEVFEYVKVLAISNDGETNRIIPEGLNDNQKRILKLCGLSENVYVKNGNRVFA